MVCHYGNKLNNDFWNLKNIFGNIFDIYELFNTFLEFFKGKDYPNVDPVWLSSVRTVAPEFNSSAEVDTVIGDKNPVTFIIVKHPFHRLVSAYRSNFARYHVT
jgi:hypothetical protein